MVLRDGGSSVDTCIGRLAGIPNCRPEDNLFSCDNNMTCIIAYWKCDGDEDCKDGSDELAEHCQDRKCDESHFTCNETLRCIPLAWACDGQPDCGLNDTSDEDHCGECWTRTASWF